MATKPKSTAKGHSLHFLSTVMQIEFQSCCLFTIITIYYYCGTSEERVLYLSGVPCVRGRITVWLVCTFAVVFETSVVKKIYMLKPRHTAAKMENFQDLEFVQRNTN